MMQAERFVGTAAVSTAEQYLRLVEADGVDILQAPNDKLSALFEKWRILKQRLETQLLEKGDISLLDVFELENLQVGLLSDKRLRTRIWSLRATYLSIVSRELGDKYLRNEPPNPKTDTIESIFADAQDLLSGIHWWYVNAFRKENALKELKRNLLLFVFLGFGFIVLMTWKYERSGLEIDPLAMVFYLIYSGLLGATVSTIRRIQPIASQPISVTSASEMSDPLVKTMALENGRLSVYLSLVMGSLFSIILYLLFVTGLSDSLGKAVPQPHLESAGCTTSLTMLSLYSLLPKSPADFAKALVWTFIAGFSERLVPDMLDRISKISQK